MCTRLCDLLDALLPKKDGASYRELITFVKDRPGHDRRYAIDASKLTPRARLEAALALRRGHPEDGRAGTSRAATWCERISNGVYARERLGLEKGAS